MCLILNGGADRDRTHDLLNAYSYKKRRQYIDHIVGCNMPSNQYTKTLPEKYGGADRDRTDDLLNAIQALSQLSYSPKISKITYFLLSRQYQTYCRNR